MAVTLAFYRGRGDVVDRVIRWMTRSLYSHVEIIWWCGTHGDDGLPEALAFSASSRDGGVRTRVIGMDPDHWDYVTIPWACQQRVAVLSRSEDGAGYDYLGIVLSQILHLRRSSGRRWFCSEIVGHALGLPFPQTLSPGDLHALVTRINHICGTGENPPED